MFPIPPRAEVRDKPILAPRLTLLPLDASDAHEIWDLVEESRSWLLPWLPWVPYQTDLDSARRFVEASIQDWDQGRALRFLIRQRPGGSLLGLVGLEAFVEMHRSCELGYWLRKDAAGRGVMTEAATHCVDFAFRQLGVHRMRVAAATGNHPSLRVIARLGFQFEGVSRHAEWCDGRWLDHAVFSLLDHEWASRCREEEQRLAEAARSTATAAASPRPPIGERR